LDKKETEENDAVIILDTKIEKKPRQHGLQWPMHPKQIFAIFDLLLAYVFSILIITEYTSEYRALMITS
jgi:hypothetical protein